MNELTIRHFTCATDVALPRTWPFHDVMADRDDVMYKLHIIGSYPGPAADLDRSYIMKPAFWIPQRGPEAWIVKSWDHPLISTAAVVAHMRGIPLLMWGERPGYTYEAKTIKDAARIALRKMLLPILFLPYRYDTVLLGTGNKAVANFCALAGHNKAKIFVYPNHIADDLLELPSRLPSATPLLLYVGSFIHRKAIDLAMIACEAAWKAGAKFRIRYVGAGPLLTDLTAHQRRYPSMVEICPFVTGTDLVEHYRVADGVLLYSRHDGWGLTAHEGIARGIPVLTSDACGAADLVKDSGCGKVIPAGSASLLADAMRWWVGLSRAERYRLSIAGHDLAQSITVPKLADKLVSYCEALV